MMQVQRQTFASPGEGHDEPVRVAKLANVQICSFLLQRRFETVLVPVAFIES